MSAQNLYQVIKIENESFRHPWSVQSFKAEIDVNRYSRYLVARCDGVVVGYIGAWIVLGEVHITTLAVKNSYRRRGIASFLFDELISKAKMEGVRFITLEVRPSNMPARSFYEKLGFKILGRRRYYYPDEDALIMSLEDLPG